MVCAWLQWHCIYFKSHATSFCIILYHSSWASLCVFRMLCGVCTLVVSEIVWVVSSIISVAASNFINVFAMVQCAVKSRKENPPKLTQLSSRSHPRHLVGKRTAQKDTIIDITSDSQVNSNFPYRWSPASLTFNNYFYLFLYLYIT